MLVSAVTALSPGDVYPGQVSWIDVAIAALVVISGLRGWSQGLLRQLGGILGRIIGLVLGFYLAASIAPRITEAVWRPLDVVLIIVTCTVACGLIVHFIGGIFSNRLHEGRLGLVDSVLGAGVGVVGMLVTCWFVAALLAVVPWSSVGQSVNHSLILKYVQHVLPSPPAVEGRLQSLLDEINVPSLFANVVAPTVPALAHGALTTKDFVVSPVGVVAVEASGGCHLINNGTGFVVAPGEVVTAAHLLAGQKLVLVDSMAGRVVLFDPRSDLAVVKVLGLDAAPLSLGSPPSRGTQGDVVGYVTPGDRASSVAVYLGSLVAPGRDIYSCPVFSRTMDVIASTITTSESGSPVLVHGAVVGVVIERAVVDTTLAYAVPVAQLRAQLARMTSATVSTQRCVS